MSPLLTLRDRARVARHHIVLPEGTDPRVRDAAGRAVAEGLARITLLAPEGTPVPPGVTLEDPKTSPRRNAMAEAFLAARARRKPTPVQAVEAIGDPLVWAALMVREGLAGGTIGGAIHTTSDTVRAALQIVGMAEGAPLVSSFFLMVLPESHPTRPGAGLIFSDCGLVIDPSPEELAAIAHQSAASARALLGVDPKVAMLSFSTKGSAHHMRVNKVIEAVEIARATADFALDGELQFDAAFDAGVGASKAPGSAVAGQANVLIFPDLDAGNIGYKIAQRIGGATAIGPVLQGLAQPANDLSRGCTADDILDMIAVTSAQIDAAHG
ncbi:phosphotransacetylase [Jannaschia pohangensis]|uniref:Phosphotransacetylase n=1 Tax=Jannaschia pohangensis TaxID=390807 RepID=A0A1I3GGF4_9RHOB|nr:phosphotransacetylase [Jannaschia pohangensis]SFI22231.1 phosphotransacetylase [Jannaschia pohangensis]